MVYADDGFYHVPGTCRAPGAGLRRGSDFHSSHSHRLDGLVRRTAGMDEVEAELGGGGGGGGGGSSSSSSSNGHASVDPDAAEVKVRARVRTFRLTALALAAKRPHDGFTSEGPREDGAAAASRVGSAG
jgi:hypothetical protein